MYLLGRINMDTLRISYGDTDEGKERREKASASASDESLAALPGKEKKRNEQMCFLPRSTQVPSTFHAQKCRSLHASQVVNPVQTGPGVDLENKNTESRAKRGRPTVIRNH